MGRSCSVCATPWALPTKITVGCNQDKFTTLQDTMAEIGAQLGVDRTTVSRTLKRGEQRLLRCLRYGGAALLRESFGEDGAENLRPPIDKRRSGVR